MPHPVHPVTCWVVSTFWLLWIILLWVWVDQNLLESLLSVLLSINLGVELLDHNVNFMFNFFRKFIQTSKNTVLFLCCLRSSRNLQPPLYTIFSCTMWVFFPKDILKSSLNKGLKRNSGFYLKMPVKNTENSFAVSRLIFQDVLWRRKSGIYFAGSRCCSVSCYCHFFEDHVFPILGTFENVCVWVFFPFSTVYHTGAGALPWFSRASSVWWRVASAGKISVSECHPPSLFRSLGFLSLIIKPFIFCVLLYSFLLLSAVLCIFTNLPVYKTTFFCCLTHLLNF